MDSDRSRIERLQVEIELKRSALAEHRAALTRLQKEVELFARQYYQVLGSLEAQLDAVRQEIESYQTRRSNPDNSIWGPGYSSFEESFNAKYRREYSGPAPLRPITDETTLRALYRRLARQYHPDTTTDPAEKTRLTLIMSQINAAYRARNADALYALEGQRGKPQSSLKPLTPQAPGYAELLAQSRQLDDEIENAQIEYNNLRASPLMILKIETSLARSRGANLLQEIAARARVELQAARAELEQLRRRG